ncbi:hypothetical protein SAMN04488542_12421 [Fontibacillus panacisegetis]|uniref:Uncharacterized protein n=1 Tax=Fontibacillus panacisegetis TaxID=670482 RepID=A0A1G7QYS2_9BACL|nr:hypothetical protein [Fontibacillus panacisegetis]SDG03678.1 hypothetical protein SAMN04488542_12421 [Fontibacillus panacisegetis]
MKVMEYVDRYIYAVTQKLQEKQRQDIEQELRGLIEDMLEERANGGEITQQLVEEVLQELGNPSELADQYRGYKRYLISPEMFTFYWTIMKIVLASIAISMTVVFMVEAITDSSQGLNHFADYFATTTNTLLQGFAWVTIVFGIIEYTGMNSKKLGIDTVTKSWKPSMLTAIPDPSIRIKKSDPIAGIIFTIFFSIIFMFALELIGVYFSTNGDGIKSIAIFDVDVFHRYLPFFLGVMALFILRDIVKLVVGKWSVKVAVFCIAVNIIWLILALILFNDQSIWNPTFMEELVRIGSGLSTEVDFQEIARIWDVSKDIWIYIVSLVVLFESIWIAMKAYRGRRI